MKTKTGTANEKKKEILFLICVFLFFLIWMFIQPFHVAPDESMRFDIPMYIYNHGTLPVGDDPELIGNLWGLSYAFFPILSYMISAFFMKIVAVFSTDFMSLLMAARFTSVVFGTGTAYLSIKVGKKLFGNKLGWLFAVVVTLLPQNVFIATYVNNDAMAIFSTALIVYFWIRGVETRWNIKSCIGLAVAISICALSYYNAYGFILCSIIIYFATYFLCYKNKEEFPLKTFLARGFLIVGIVLILAGWWFVRSAILYNGDFLGMKAMDICAEANAAPGIKPSEHPTPLSKGMSFVGMLFGTNWVIVTVASFIGCFGGMNLWMPHWMYVVYGLFFFVALLACVTLGRKVFRLRDKDSRKFCDKGILVWILILAAIIPILLSMYNSYASDYQPQGRYVLPMVFPFGFFVTWGAGKLVERFSGNRIVISSDEPEAIFPVTVDKKSDRIIKIIMGTYIVLCILGYVTTMVPHYLLNLS